jgi:hypothetical protein
VRTYPSHPSHSGSHEIRRKPQNARVSGLRRVRTRRRTPSHSKFALTVAGRQAAGRLTRWTARPGGSVDKPPAYPPAPPPTAVKPVCHRHRSTQGAIDSRAEFAPSRRDRRRRSLHRAAGHRAARASSFLPDAGRTRAPSSQRRPSAFEPRAPGAFERERSPAATISPVVAPGARVIGRRAGRRRTRPAGR